VRLLAVRVLAVLCALTWLVLPGFGLIDLSVTWDPGWPVVLEASWGVFMTVLVGGSFLTVAVHPRRSAPAFVVLVVALAAMLAAAAAGLEWQLLGYAAVLVVELPVLFLAPGRERVRPVVLAPWLPLVLVAVAGAVPWLVHAARMFGANRGDAGPVTSDVTMSVDHFAVQGRPGPGARRAVPGHRALAAGTTAPRPRHRCVRRLPRPRVVRLPLELGGVGPAVVGPLHGLGRGDRGPGGRRPPATAAPAPQRGRRGPAIPVTARPCATP
jgi:hypothetical protein